MKNLKYAFRCQSLLLKAIFFMFLISANASLTLEDVKQPREPGYHCRNKKYTFSQVEATRRVACKAFLSTRDDARRPLVTQDHIDVENLIYQWSLPARPTNHPTDEGKNDKGKIVFNNRCELINVVYYDPNKIQDYLCQKVSKVSSITTSRKNKVPENPVVQCGSLALKIEEIQEYARSKFLHSLPEFFEVKNTFDRIDGPWKRALFSKTILISRQPHDVHYEIVVDKKDEVRGMVVTHHIGRKLISARTYDAVKYHGSRRTRLKKETIRLVCFFDKTFPLLRPTPSSDVSNPLKRKTLA
ncbi:BgtE-5715 [Blumeria graminis f. sp. tritici]|uniref:BgtE-5715 n=2 Tax=Blumeria graminis f. sp. tritici TaxID=62690 RepID=A0A9X9MFS5_BLUGR|nr:hypothetical protein BGT96224_A21226 [Blumeria graminis f. sp. tritici 96224]VDB85769.1 BgtE-5715 [Blumeria graminis f. sp. tritici]